MKQLMLNTYFGHFALVFREKISLLSAAIWNVESVGTKANDLLGNLIITKICMPNKTFVDVGAHIGSVLSEVHRNDKSIDIVAFEAIPEKATNLRNNFLYAKVHECAVGEREGEVSFFVNKTKSGYSSLKKPPGGNVSYTEINVKLNKIDNIISGNNVDVMKIDVEGAEIGVIRGAVRLLAESRPVVMFESCKNGRGDSGSGVEELWKIFSQLEYTILVPNRLAHNGAGLSLQSFIDSHIYPRRTTNYFAVPTERRAEIRDRARQITGVKVGAGSLRS